MVISTNWMLEMYILKLTTIETSLKCSLAKAEYHWDNSATYVQWQATTNFPLSLTGHYDIG